MIIRTLPGLTINTEPARAITPARRGTRRGVHQGTSSIAPQQGVYQLMPRGGRTIMKNGNRYGLTPVYGVNYYTLDGLDSIFSKIGKRIAKIVKGAVRVVGKVAKIALPVAAGVVGVKFLAPVVGKGFSAIFHKGIPKVPIASNPGISLPGTVDYSPVPTNAPMPQPSPGDNPPGPTYYPQPSGQPQAAGQTAQPEADTTPGAMNPPAGMPSWVMPVGLGAAAVFALMAMSKGGRRVRA